VGTSAAP